MGIRGHGLFWPFLGKTWRLELGPVCSTELGAPRVSLGLGRAGRAHMDLIYPWTSGLGRGLGHYVREPPGQEDWGLGQGSLGSYGLPAVPHQPCVPAPSLTQLEWGSEKKKKKLGHHCGLWDSLKPTKTPLSLYLHGRRRP